MFDETSHAKLWIFKSKDLQLLRLNNNRNYIHEYENKSKKRIDSSLFLTVDDELVVLRFYSEYIIAFKNPEIFTLQTSTFTIALTLFRRFYIIKCIMDYDPAEISLVCLYLATKIDEAHISCEKFIEKCELTAINCNLSPFLLTRNRICKLELVVMDVISYNLCMYTPFTCLNGLFVYFDTQLSKELNGIVGSVRGLSEDYIFQAMLTDIPLLYSPSMIAFTSLLLAVNTEFGQEQKKSLCNAISSKLSSFVDLECCYDEMSYLINLTCLDHVNEILGRLKQSINQDHVEYRVENNESAKKLKYLSSLL